MTEPDPVVLQALLQFARDLQTVDADEAWARLAHLSDDQRGQVERAVGDLASVVKEHDGRAGK